MDEVGKEGGDGRVWRSLPCPLEREYSLTSFIPLEEETLAVEEVVVDCVDEEKRAEKKPFFSTGTGWVVLGRGFSSLEEED